MKEATFYSLDENLKAHDQGPVTCDRAKEIFDQYYARLRPQYESGETALAATMFGFSRSKNEFLEFCLHKYDSISCTLCLPPGSGTGLMRFVTPSLNHEETLSSRDAALERIRQFFTMSADQLREALEAT